jgi:hypothetical protein
MNRDERDDGPFLGRWARRKAEARRPRPQLDTRTDASGTARKTATDGPVAGDGPVADAPGSTEADDRPLPSLDDITPEGDIAAFLERRIPVELQRLALRKAWASDPTISSFIEMAENQWDWNTPGGAPGWGPLDPGADLEMLLAQATGRGSPPGPTGDVASAGAAVDEIDCDKPTHVMSPASDGRAAARFDAMHNAAGAEQPENLTVDVIDSTEPARARHEAATCGLRPNDMLEKTHGDATQNSPGSAQSRARRHGGALPRG